MWSSVKSKYPSISCWESCVNWHTATTSVVPTVQEYSNKMKETKYECNTMHTTKTEIKQGIHVFGSKLNPTRGKGFAHSQSTRNTHAYLHKIYRDRQDERNKNSLLISWLLKNNTSIRIQCSQYTKQSHSFNLIEWHVSDLVQLPRSSSPINRLHELCSSSW